MGEFGTYRASAALAVLLIAAGSLTGCHTVSCRGDRAFPLAAPFLSFPVSFAAPQHFASRNSSTAERRVDECFAAARECWIAAESAVSGGPSIAMDWTKYNACVAELLDAAVQSGRFCPTQGLVIHDGHTTTTVPVAYHGFAWSAADFQSLSRPSLGPEPLLQRHYACPGIGSPLVVKRARRDECAIESRFYPTQSAFSATAVLRFDTEGAAVLEFHNPHVTTRVAFADGRTRIARDFSGSLAESFHALPQTYLSGLVHPGDIENSARLTFLEPYQPGKIPVVILHGLFSDPQGCTDLVNDLQASASFSDQFQVWLYQYPTGEPILRSAAGLRDELRSAVELLDPQRADPALQQIVLIGHSMGGLIAKLQVTYAEERIWKRLANRPLEEIVTTERTRGELARMCFFDPSPDVRRVIFIATPHQGALPTSECAGKGASLLVHAPPQQKAMHQQLIADNPHAFARWIERGLPTSIDMLAPESPLLDVMQSLPISDCVSLHNIIGVSHPISCDGVSDGVVSANSAHHPGCQSVLTVAESHSEIHHSRETAAEILRILLP